MGVAFDFGIVRSLILVVLRMNAIDAPRVRPSEGAWAEEDAERPRRHSNAERRNEIRHPTQNPKSGAAPANYAFQEARRFVLSSCAPQRACWSVGRTSGMDRVSAEWARGRVRSIPKSRQPPGGNHGQG
jgi:hypothetical protein